jgi:hypothetical protein
VLACIAIVVRTRTLRETFFPESRELSRMRSTTPGEGLMIQAPPAVVTWLLFDVHSWNTSLAGSL